ncbi:MAG: hypothetical protein FJ395_18975 [Verrucomicrobia bacterium]|nr:hypothetical protein [Verrucomicrobiota bacterium]
MKWIKLLVAIALLPACAGITLAAWTTAHRILPKATDTTSLALLGGYALWLVIFVALPKPTRTYILGHELTHAFWALLMGARVGNIDVRKTSGRVQISKTNWFITLAPYFFPFYAMLFIALFFIAHWIGNLTAWFWVLFALVGFGWSFHVTFTLMILFTVSQPDVKSQGVLFSAVVIYAMNLLTMLITATALFPALRFTDLGAGLWQNTLVSYGWTLDKLLLLWQHVRHAIGH